MSENKSAGTSVSLFLSTALHGAVIALIALGPTFIPGLSGKGDRNSNNIEVTVSESTPAVQESAPEAIPQARPEPTPIPEPAPVVAAAPIVVKTPKKIISKKLPKKFKKKLLSLSPLLLQKK